MPWVSTIDPATSSPGVKAAIRSHLGMGYRLTNEKLTLLHNVTAFDALEDRSYAVDRELQRLVGKRAADLFEYAISVQNDFQRRPAGRTGGHLNSDSTGGERKTVLSPQSICEVK